MVTTDGYTEINDASVQTECSYATPRNVSGENTDKIEEQLPDIDNATDIILKDNPIY